MLTVLLCLWACTENCNEGVAAASAAVAAAMVDMRLVGEFNQQDPKEEGNCTPTIPPHDTIFGTKAMKEEAGSASTDASVTNPK